MDNSWDKSYRTSQKPLGNLSETSRKPLGNLSETSRKPLGNLSETFRKPLGNLSETRNLSETSRKPLETSQKPAGGLTYREVCRQLCQDIKPQTIGWRYAASGLPMIFPTTYPAKNLCLTRKVKISVRTKLPQSVYIYIYTGSGRFPGPMELLLQQLVRVSKTR